MCLAIPGRIIEFADDARRFATVDFSGVRRQVNMDLLRETAIATGDWVLIHVGFALSQISAEQAEEQLRLLDVMGETEQSTAEISGYTFGSDA